MTIIWGWVLVSMMNIILAMVLAEICSSFPTSGGVYFFAHRLAGAQGRVSGISVMLAAAAASSKPTRSCARAAV